MAIASVQLVNLVTDQGEINFTLQYDDATMKAISVTCVNPTTQTVTGTVTRNSDGRVFSRAFGPGNTTLNLPTSGANSITVTLNSRGRVDGYDFSVG